MGTWKHIYMYKMIVKVVHMKKMNEKKMTDNIKNRDMKTAWPNSPDRTLYYDASIEHLKVLPREDAVDSYRFIMFSQSVKGKWFPR